MDRLEVQSCTVQSLEELREWVGTPHEAVVKKSIGLISEEAKGFISQSPMMFLSTSSGDGACDVIGNKVTIRTIARIKWAYPVKCLVVVPIFFLPSAAKATLPGLD